MTDHFDAIVIGAGQAGPTLAVRLANEGMKVAIVERKLFGGTCVNTGCIPSKTLIASAYAAHLARRSEEYGITIKGAINVDMKKVKARKDAIVKRSNKGLEQWLRDTKNLTVYQQHACFDSANTIRVDDSLLTADKIFINVGARAFVPDIPGLSKIDYFDNASIMDVDFVPRHLVIIGGSYIGLEFAQMYKRFGSKVTIIEKSSRVIPKEDEDISECVKTIFENEAIDIRLNAECIELSKQGDDIAVSLECDSDDKQVVGSHLLLAVGRAPNTHDLGLDKVGIETDERGFITVNDALETSVSNIWALGECNGQGAFTHTSYNDYEIVADNLLNNGSRKVSDRILIYGLFIDPPLARVGMSETDVKASGKKALIGTRPMTRVSRAIEKGETQGFMKVIVDADTNKILGATILGMSGDEAIHAITDVMYAGKPYTTITHAVHIHPTVAELIPTVFGELKPVD